MGETGIKAIAVEIDVRNKGQINKMKEKVIETFDKIGVLVKNAGIAEHVNVGIIGYYDWLNVMDIDSNSLFLVSQAIGNIMVKQKEG